MIKKKPSEKRREFAIQVISLWANIVKTKIQMAFEKLLELYEYTMKNKKVLVTNWLDKLMMNQK